MARYARIENDAVVEVRNFDIAPDPNPVKGLDWRPYPKVAPPTHDSATHHAPVLSTEVQAEQVVDTYAAPVAKTAQELDDEAKAVATDKAKVTTAKLVQTVMAHNFDLENRVRALESKQPITASQYLTALPGLPNISFSAFVAWIKANF